MQFVGNFVFIFCISAILFFSISVKSDLYLWESAADRGGDPSVLVGAAREQSLFFISCSWPFRPSSMVVAIAHSCAIFLFYLGGEISSWATN